MVGSRCDHRGLALRHSFVQNDDVPIVVKELEKLSKDKGWYVRGYVIEMMRREPGLKVVRYYHQNLGNTPPRTQ